MKSRCVRFEIQGLPPSENHALNRARNGRMYPSKEYKEWKELVGYCPIKEIEDSEWYAIKRTYYFPLRYKNGNIKRKDVCNLVKYADDEIVKRLITVSGRKIDDKQIIIGSEEKIDCKPGEERTVLVISPCIEDD